MIFFHSDMVFCDCPIKSKEVTLPRRHLGIFFLFLFPISNVTPLSSFPCQKFSLRKLMAALTAITVVPTDTKRKEQKNYSTEIFSGGLSPRRNSHIILGKWTPTTIRLRSPLSMEIGNLSIMPLPVSISIWLIDLSSAACAREQKQKSNEKVQVPWTCDRKSKVNSPPSHQPTRCCMCTMRGNSREIIVRQDI